MRSQTARLTLRQRLGWGAHLFRAVTRQHHLQLLPLFRQSIPLDGIVIDVGAQAGQYTKIFSRLAPQGHVHAFEPGQYAQSVLRRVIAWRALKNVTLHPVGLSDRESTETLHMPIKKSGSLSFGLPHIGACDGPKVSEEIRLTTLDAFAAKEGLMRVDFIKVDIEGWEVHFLKGAQNTIETFQPVIFAEVNDAFLKRAGNSAREMWDCLKSFGYNIYELHEDNAGLTPLSSPLLRGDVWCVPPGKFQ